MNHDHIEELLALEALGDLSPADASLLADEQTAHGPTCADCARLESEMAETTAALAMTLDPIPLPAGMADAILSRPDARPAVATAPGPVVSLADHETRTEKKRGGVTRRILAIAAAVILVAGVLGGGALYLGGSQQRQLNAFKAEPGTEVYPFTTEFAGTLEVASNPDDGRFFVVGEGIQPMNEGQEYQLWMITGKDKPVPGPTFTPSDGEVLESYDISTSGADVMAVTIEPAGGSPQPTTDPIFIAELT